MAGVQSLRDGLRSAAARWFERPAAAALARLGVGPAMATMLGVAGAGAAAYFASQGEFVFAGVLVFVAALFDLVDGALARRAGAESRRGALLDSTADRVSEFAVLLGLAVYFTAPETADRTGSILTLVALAGSILISYIRARAEGLGLPGREGLLTRPERVVIMGAGLLAGQPLVIVWILGVGAPVGALQRFWMVWRSAVDDES